ncbi:hypothetical protein BJ912DRAFT_860280 [Pholiota molesta]|nr:hypothetical protein BJ912DRAFT_860280 [Pholiota molesta]
MSTPASSVASHELQQSDITITSTTTRMTKREHAMHELLSSERAYASDLALIREVHIPLALGEHPFSSFLSHPSSSSSSTKATSTSSSESLNTPQPPMTPEDAKIIFSNVSELAMFSDMFTEELELALGDVVEGGRGDDFVGALFLRIIPDLERPYKTYITRHPTALAHLQALPQTPALQSYLAYTQSIASSVSHAWDLASLLIKPVQRLLKYPLLLGAIIDETPDGHPDKDNLKRARVKVEEIARNVNEGRRRAEVVKDVLASKSPRKPNAPVGVAASVNLSKVKSLRHGGVTAATMRVAQLTEGNASEAAQVDAMQAELKRIEVFAQQFAKNVVDWGKMMANVMLALRGWALSFGKVIGLSAEQHSEAFDAFLAVVTEGLLPLTVDLDSAINERLLKDMAHLLMTMSQPLKLLASMAEQEPYHYHLLTMPVSPKNRPPPALLEASTNYLALRGQLAAELPAYLGLLHKGCAVFVRRLAGIQTRFWRDVKERWAELWEMLRVEGELNAGYEETINVWCARWADVDEVVRALNITRPPAHSPVHRKQSNPTAVASTLASLSPSHAPSNGGGSSMYVGSGASMYSVSAPMPLGSMASLAHAREGKESSARKGRGRGASDASTTASNSKTSGSGSSGAGDFDEYMKLSGVMMPPSYEGGLPSSSRSSKLTRRKSMPLSQQSGGTDQASLITTTTVQTVGQGAQLPNGAGFMVEGDRLYYQPPLDERDEYPLYQEVSSRQMDKDTGRDRGRLSHSKSHPTVPMQPVVPSPAKPKSKERATHARKRSGSTKSITSFFTGGSSDRNSNPNPPDPQPLTASQRDSWVSKPAKYTCQVVHPCRPPAAVQYYSFPFFTLQVGDFYEVLQEAGHPSIHPKLPLYVDDGEDCLLLCRDGYGIVGWALASFLEPVTM